MEEQKKVEMLGPAAPLYCTLLIVVVKSPSAFSGPLSPLLSFDPTAPCQMGLFMGPVGLSWEQFQVLRILEV
jgi:hypothetical protein